MPRMNAAALAGACVIALTVAKSGAARAQATPPEDPRIAALEAEVGALKAQVKALTERLDHTAPATTTPVATAAPAPPPPATAPSPAPTAVAQTAPPASPPAAGRGSGLIADALKGMTVSAALDTYYEYNTNRPIGRVNLLRAYDVSSNSFSLNQADLIVESAPDVDQGKRWGMRLDLQYGQATDTLQGNPVNELRPEVYRAIYQAYGTYVVPLGSGLTVDVGKWASSLGLEGNYTKDQFNYSRSFWFGFLPFYHTGLRAKYQVNSLVGVNLWIVNGAEQTEANNSYKDQLYGVVLTPTPQITWTLNYYRGQEHPDVEYIQNPTAAQAASLPNQQGTYFLPIAHPPTGLLNIGDTYATWQVTPRLTLAAEADYVEERLFKSSPEQDVWGGALYLAYQLTPKVALAARGEYLDDRNGLYTGLGQTLKETTFTLDYRPEDGFLLRGEFRRDWSNRPYFYSDALARLLSDQPTIGLGAVWWFGQKQGSW